MAIELTDDGTLDTVLQCSECGEKMRYTYDPNGPDANMVDAARDAQGADDYAAFIEWAIADATADHECGDVCDECGELIPSNEIGQSRDDRHARSCSLHPEAEPTEPQEDDLTTTDHENFYQNGKLVLQRERTYARELTDRWYSLDKTNTLTPLTRGTLKNAGVHHFGDDHLAALRAYMDRVQFWPNVWFISDHGNAHLIDLTEGK